MAIGYDASRVKTPPTSFKSLLTGPYKNMVALNGNPTQAGAAFAGVYAAALANGGSFASNAQQNTAETIVAQQWPSVAS